MVQHIEPQAAHKTLLRKSKKMQHTQTQPLRHPSWKGEHGLTFRLYFFPHLGTLCRADPV